jgi:putative nucleotidyltransferase with HDIG domain
MNPVQTGVVEETTASALLRGARDLGRLPALNQARGRLLDALHLGDGSLSEVVAAAEASVPLTLTLLRAANRRRASRRSVASVTDALEMLDPGTIEAAAMSVPVYDMFDLSEEWGLLPGQIRMHAIAVRGVAERIAATIDANDLETLRTAALLHDIGKALMVRAFGDAAAGIYPEAITPEAEVRRERELFDLDHAASGAWLLRHWRLPERLAVIVEHHHQPGSDVHASVILVADMLVHYTHGRPVDVDRLSTASAEIGLTRKTLGTLMYELPDSSALPSRRVPEPCPMSERELGVLSLLAEGKVYKQIARDLDLSPSTVRSHLHRTYRRMGVIDRTQAVLMATELGWL